MPERYLIVDHLKLGYEGLFNIDELYAVVSSWFFEKNWDWYEKMNQEQVTPNGKQIHIIFEPWKCSSDYYKIVMVIKLNIHDVKEVEIEQEGQTLKLHQGTIRFIFDGHVVSDRKGSWHHKPLWFFSFIMDRYFFKNHFEKMETWIKSDIDDLYNYIKTYLNTFKYSYHS